MALVLRYRGRNVHTEDVETIQALIAAGAPSRRALSQQVCQSWGWVQANGQMCDSTCRKLLLALHRAGHITLPPPRCHRRTATAALDEQPSAAPSGRSPGAG